MFTAGRGRLLFIAVIIAALVLVFFAGQMQWIPRLGSPLVWIVVLIGIVGIVLIMVLRPAEAIAEGEFDNIEEIDPSRRLELIRGTSLHLREMRYRYSVRADHSDRFDRRCFTATVNTIRLGFVPVIIMDNTSDTQGFGFVAFVYDERRWRGPGLPCPGDVTEALEHAKKCVSPLSEAGG